MWFPINQQPHVMATASLLAEHDMRWLLLMGRLRPSVTRGQAEAVLTTRLRQFLLADEGPKPPKDELDAIGRAKIDLTPGAGGISALRFRYSEPLHILFAMVALVLAIACANVAIRSFSACCLRAFRAI